MLVYLASPYSHADPEIKLERFERVCKAAAKLMEAGYEVFCPIAHSHPIEVHGMSYVHSGEFWLNQDYAILKHCDALIVFKLDGWDSSDGIYHEVVFAFENNIPVWFMEDETDVFAYTISGVHSSESLCEAQREREAA